MGRKERSRRRALVRNQADARHFDATIVATVWGTTDCRNRVDYDGSRTHGRVAEKV